MRKERLAVHLFGAEPRRLEPHPPKSASRGNAYRFSFFGEKVAESKEKRKKLLDEEGREERLRAVKRMSIGGDAELVSLSYSDLNAAEKDSDVEADFNRYFAHQLHLRGLLTKEEDETRRAKKRQEVQSEHEIELSSTFALMNLAQGDRAIDETIKAMEAEVRKEQLRKQAEHAAVLSVVRDKKVVLFAIDAAVDKVLKRSAHFQQISRTSAATSGGTLGKGAKRGQTLSELSSTEGLVHTLKNSKHIAGCVAAAASLCTRTLMTLLPRTIFYGDSIVLNELAEQRRIECEAAATDTEDREVELFVDTMRATTAVLSSLLSEDEHAELINTATTNFVQNFAKKQCHVPGENMAHAVQRQRKIVERKLQTASVGASKPVDSFSAKIAHLRPLCVIAANEGKWLSLTCPGLKQPPLHLPEGASAREEEEDTVSLLPIAAVLHGAVGTAREVDLVRRFGRHYALFLMSLERHPERAFLTTMTPTIVSEATRAVVEGFRERNGLRRAFPSACTGIDVGSDDELVKRPSGAETLTQAAEDALETARAMTDGGVAAAESISRRKHIVQQILSRLEDEILFLLTGLDQNDPNSSTQPLSQTAVFRWQGHISGESPSIDSEVRRRAPSPVRRMHPESEGGMGAIAVFDRLAGLNTQSSSGRATSPCKPRKTHKELIDYFYGTTLAGGSRKKNTRVSGESGEQAKYLGDDEDLSGETLAVELHKIRYPRSSLKSRNIISFDGAKSQQLSVTASLIGQKEASVVDAFRTARNRTLLTTQHPWYEVGARAVDPSTVASASRPHTGEVLARLRREQQKGAFNLLGTSPLLAHFLSSPSSTATPPSPRAVMTWHYN